MKKHSIFDYIKLNNDNLTSNNINEIDALIFAELAYINYDKVIIDKPINLIDILKIINSSKIKTGLIVPNELKKLPKSLLNSNRFNVLVSNYQKIINEENKIQFQALTFHLKDSIIISFSGTDDTLIGWYENFYAITKNLYNSQIKALEYLEEISNKYKDKKIFITGQSKGGNMTTYSSIFASNQIKDRIIKAFDFDGPGISFDIDNDLLINIKDKLFKYMPTDSIIGRLLFQYNGNIKKVKSKSFGFFQHNSFIWPIYENKFIESNFSRKSNRINIKVSKFLNNLTLKEKENACEDLYILINNLNKKTLMGNFFNPLTLFKILKNMNFKNIKLFMKFFLIMMF